MKIGRCGKFDRLDMVDDDSHNRMVITFAKRERNQASEARRESALGVVIFIPSERGFKDGFHTEANRRARLKWLANQFRVIKRSSSDKVQIRVKHINRL